MDGNKAASHNWAVLCRLAETSVQVRGPAKKKREVETSKEQNGKEKTQSFPDAKTGHCVP